MWQVLTVGLVGDNTYTCQVTLIDRLAVVKESKWTVYRYRDRPQFNQMRNSLMDSFWTIGIEPFQPDKIPATSWFYLKRYTKPEFRILPGYPGRIPLEALQEGPSAPSVGD